MFDSVKPGQAVHGDHRRAAGKVLSRDKLFDEPRAIVTGEVMMIGVADKLVWSQPSQPLRLEIVRLSFLIY
jgi:hypothetical protein